MAVPEVIKQRIPVMHGLPAQDQIQLINLLNGLVDGIRVVTAKLDADAGVTDVNYTALFDAQFTK